MSRYVYSAIDFNKKTVKGTVSAESPYAARKHLRTKGLHPISIKESTLDKDSRSIARFFKRKSIGQIARFTRQLSTMISTGIKLTEALSVLHQQVPDINLRNAVTDIRDRVVTGESFADALSDHDDYFDLIYVSMVRVGEVTGTLSASLATIASFIERRQRLESKLMTAMIYPVILVILCIGAVLYLTIYVIPVIAEQIAKTGQQLPWLTRAVVNTSNVLTSWWAVVIIAAIGLIGWAM